MMRKGVNRILVMGEPAPGSLVECFARFGLITSCLASRFSCRAPFSTRATCRAPAHPHRPGGQPMRSGMRYASPMTR